LLEDGFQRVVTEVAVARKAIEGEEIDHLGVVEQPLAAFQALERVGDESACLPSLSALKRAAG